MYELEYSYLRHVTTLPGIETFGEPVNQALAWLVQWCSNFNSFVSEIQHFKYSRSIEKNTLLSYKLSASKTDQEFQDMLNDEEKYFSDTLFNMYVTLHFEIISDQDKQKLHFWHKKVLELLNPLEVTKKEELKNLL